jgi:hypothetical protein
MQRCTRFSKCIRAPNLKTAKEVVFSNTALRLNFDVALNFMPRSANDNATVHRTKAQVSAVSNGMAQGERRREGKAFKVAIRNLDSGLKIPVLTSGESHLDLGLGGSIVNCYCSPE